MAVVDIPWRDARRMLLACGLVLIDDTDTPVWVARGGVGCVGELKLVDADAVTVATILPQRVQAEGAAMYCEVIWEAGHRNTVSLVCYKVWVVADEPLAHSDDDSLRVVEVHEQTNRCARVPVLADSDESAHKAALKWARQAPDHIWSEPSTVYESQNVSQPDDGVSS